MAYLKSLATTFVWVSTILAVITFIPGLPPYIDFSPYNFKLPVAVNSQLNSKFSGGEKLFEGEIKGPEAFDSYDGILYTTLHRGFVSKLVGNKLVNVVKFGQDCDGFWEEEKCGRPLGLKFDKHGMLYVVDTYYGIFKVDVKTGKYEKIIDISLPIGGKVPMLPNSIDIAGNGDLFWTDSSTDFKLSNGLLVMLCNPSGRLIRYNVATKQNEVLLENLAFANGIKLSDDESYVLVAETGASRIIKYHLRGPHAGKSEIFIEGLPGLPDNIDADGQGNILVNLITTADEEHPQLVQSLAPHSNLRKMIVRTITLLQTPFKFLEEVYSNYYAKRIVHWLGHFESVHFIFSISSAILRVDKNGQILNVLSTANEDINGVSSSFPFGDYFYLGSPFNEYLVRVPLNEALPDLKTNSKNEHRVINQKPQSVSEKQTVSHPAEVPTPAEKLAPSTPVMSYTTERPLSSTSSPRTTVPESMTITSAPAPPPSTTAAPLPPSTTPSSLPPVHSPKVNSGHGAPVVAEVPTASKHVETLAKSTEKPVVPQLIKKQIHQQGKPILKDEM